MSRRLLATPLVALVTLMSVLLAACGGGDAEDQGADGDGPFRVLLIAPMSGAQATAGAAYKSGMNAVVDILNDRGGINGHPVEVKILDTGGDPNEGVSLLQQELSSGTAYNLIVPGTSSNEASPLVPLLAENSAIQFSPALVTTLNDPEKYPNYFTTSPPFGDQIEAVIAEIQKTGVSRVGIVAPDTEAGHTPAAALREQAGAAGLVAQDVYIPTESVDATAQLQQLQAAGVEALVMTGFTPTYIPALKARTKLGWTVPVYGDVSFAANDFTRVSEADLAGVTVMATPYLVAGTEVTESETFRTWAAALHKYDPNPKLGMVSYLTMYQFMMLAAAGAQESGSIVGTDIARAVETLEDGSRVEGWIGSEKLYTPEDHFPRFQNSDFIFVTPGPKDKGLMVPGGTA